jgi:hypothetical protein
MNKKLIDIGKDFTKDLIGFDRGILITILTLIKSPITVVKGYQEKSSTYTSPFSLIAFSTALILLVGQWIVPWDALKADFTGLVNTYLGGNNDIFLYFIFRLIKNYLAVTFITIAIVNSAISSVLTRKIQITFYDHVVSHLYHASVSILTITVILFFSFLRPGIFICVAIGILVLIKVKFSINILRYYETTNKTRLASSIYASNILSVIVISPIWVGLYHLQIFK